MEVLSLDFIGRLHPLLVHLPIGMYMLFVFLFLFRGHWMSAKLIDGILFSGAVVSTMTAYTGYVLSPLKGYDIDWLFYHKWLGISIAFMGWVLWGIHRNTVNKNLTYIVSTLLGILIILTGHFGGSLTHGKNYLFPSKRIHKVSVSVDSIQYYAHVVKPILNEYCLACHQPAKSNGGWDISTDSALFKGGKYGHTIIPGDGEHSELIKRLESSLDSKKHMPPITMPQPKPIELFLLKEWIKQGAKTDAYNIEPTLLPIVHAYLGISGQTKKDRVLPTVKPIDTLVYHALKKNIGIVHPVTEGSNLLDVSLIHFRNKSKAEILAACNQLKAVSENMYWLDLSALGLIADDLEFLSGMKNLNKLNLSNNKVDDNLVKYIAKWPNLELLNVYGSYVTEKGKQEILKQTKIKLIGLE